MMLAVPADSVFAGLAEVELRALENQPFIMYSRSHSSTMHLLTMQAFQQLSVRPRIVQQAVQVQTMLGLVEGGVGLALVPESAARLCGQALRLVPLAGNDVFQVGTALAVMPEAISPTAQHFIDQALAVSGIG
jgi:DNA-binding transcriptional LysR family regulator